MSKIMDLGIVQTIRWALGIDKELEQLRAQFAKTTTEYNAKIEALQSSLNDTKNDHAKEIGILRDKLEKTSDDLETQAKNAETYLTLRTQLEHVSSDIEKKLNTTSKEVLELKEIVIPKRVPLLTAPFWNYTEAVAIKLKPFINSNFGRKAMNLASSDNQPELITLFVKLGIKIDSKSLWVAAEEGNTEAFDRLLEHGADLNVRGENGHVLFQTSGSFCRNMESRRGSGSMPNNKLYSCLEKTMIKMIDNGHNISHPHDTNLFYAANLGLYAVIERLIESGANINEIIVGREPNTVLAACGSHIGAMAKVIEVGALNVTRGFLDMVGFVKAGCKQQYIYFFLEKLYPTEECANGMAEFLYIIKELQTAYTEDMRSSAHVQADYTLNSHMEDTSLLGCHE